MHVAKRFLRRVYDKKVFETWEAELAFDKDISKTIFSVHRRKDTPHNKYKLYIGNERFMDINIMENIFEEMGVLRKKQEIAAKQERDKRYKPDFVAKKQRTYQIIFDELQNVKA